MQLKVRHETIYRYDEPVSYSIQALKLTPRTDSGQRVVGWRIQCPGDRIEQIDPYGNIMHVVTLEVGHGVTAGGRDSHAYNHYGLLAGLYQTLGLGTPPNAAAHAAPLPIG